jgi:uncharacterized protein
MNDLFKKVHPFLPVFEIKQKLFDILYTPGFIVKIDKSISANLSSILKYPNLIKDTTTKNSIINLLNTAELALIKWESIEKAPFIPECLTIHVGNNCNMACSYCYAKNEKTGNKNIVGYPAKESIEILLSHIIRQIDRKTNRLSVVYHGSGEPTLHWRKLVDTHKYITTVARMNKLEIFSYIATNGSISEIQTDWLIKNINLIGVSCDGPRIIQEKQRHSVDNKTIPIDKICKRIKEKGGHFNIRVTVTKETMLYQTEIAEYLIDECRATNIRFEPVYLAEGNSLNLDDADRYFTNFSAAQKYSEKRGVRLDYSGVRLEELHGSYCDILRNTLRLTPDNLTRNCFCFLTNKEEFITGKINRELSFYEPVPGLTRLKANGSRIPDQCMSCINVLHCSRGCPDFCTFDEANMNNQRLNKFRCRFHQLLATDKIKTLAGNLL